MKLNGKVSKIFILALAVVMFSGCATVLKVNYNPLPNPDNFLASIPSVKVKLAGFNDNRENSANPMLIGGVKRAVVAQTEDVISDKSVSDIINEAIRSELIRNGHSVVDGGEDFTIRGDVKIFWVYTKVSLEDWRVLADSKVALELTNTSTGESVIAGPYHGKNNELRYLEPDGTIYKRVIEAALSDMIKQMTSDSSLASALKKK